MQIADKSLECMTYDLPLSPGAAAVGASQGGGAGLGVPGDVAVLRGAADGQRVDAVGVAVTVTTVSVSTPISRGPDKDGAQSSSTLVKTVTGLTL